MTRRLLRYPDLKARGWPYSYVQTWRLERAGKFIKSVKVYPGSNTKAWFEDEFEAFIESRREARDSGLDTPRPQAPRPRTPEPAPVETKPQAPVPQRARGRPRRYEEKDGGVLDHKTGLFWPCRKRPPRDSSTQNTGIQG